MASDKQDFIFFTVMIVIYLLIVGVFIYQSAKDTISTPQTVHYQPAIR